MRLLSTRATPFVIFAAMALGACDDHLNPTKPAPEDPNRLIVCDEGCGGGGGGGGGGGSPPPPPAPPVITSATAPAYLDKDGIHMQWAVSLSNGQTGLSQVSVSSSVIASGVEVATGSRLVSCGLAVGTLPPGTCSMTNDAAFPLSGAVRGFPVGGAVTFKVYLWNNFTLLDSKSYTTTVYDDRPAVFPLTPGSGPLFIGGPSRTFAGTIHNPSTGFAWSGISVRPFVSQSNGAVVHFSTVAAINCGSGAGVLPIGDCNISGTYSISNTSPGSGTLTEGPANFGIQLLDAAGDTIGGAWVNATLVSPPSVNSGSAPSDVTLGVAVPGGFNVQLLNNNSAALPNSMTVKAVLTQGSSVARTVGSAKVACAGSDGTATGMPAGPGKFCSFAGQVLVNTGIVDPSVDKGSLTTTPEGTSSSIEFWIIDDASGAVLAKGGSQFVLLHSAP